MQFDLDFFPPYKQGRIVNLQDNVAPAELPWVDATHN